jgi:hypothetical protein
MILIAAHMSRTKWIQTLRKRGVDPEGVASEVLWFLYERLGRANLSVSDERVLVAFLHTSIRNKIISMHRSHIATASAAADSQTANDDADKLVGNRRATPDVDIARFALAMRTEEDQIVGEIFRRAREDGRNPDLRKLQVMYRYVCRQVVRQNTVLTHRELPHKIKLLIHIDDHATNAYLLNRFIRQFAASLNDA